MKIVLDTNVLVSAVVFSGKPKRLIEKAIESDIELFISPFIEAELHRVLGEKFSFDKAGLVEVRRFIEDNFVTIRPESIPTTVKRDPVDNNILALAQAASADYVVSGDNDLLDLGSYQGISILTPDQFLESRD